MLKITQIPVGMAQSNCYILSNGKNALIIDPGQQASVITHHIEQLNVTPVAILLTHTHYDHIGALESIRTEYEIPVYVSAAEQAWLTNPNLNLSALTGEPIHCREAEFVFEGSEDVTIEDFTFKVVPTPGHSPGGVSFIFAEDALVITGDALFTGSVGRTDLPGSEPKKLFDSIRAELFTLPEDYTIYPGHGGASTIGTEIQTNPFF